jgi:hypothetical protein
VNGWAIPAATVGALGDTVTEVTVEGAGEELEEPPQQTWIAIKVDRTKFKAVITGLRRMPNPLRQL